MNTRERIERCLKAAPKPLAQDGLLDKLQEDVAIGKIRTQRSALQRWFVPTGGQISVWRVAAAAVIAIVVLLPLSYGADKLIKLYHLRFESKQVSDDGTVTVTTTEVTLAADSFADEEEAKRVWQETQELKKAGKYEKTFRKEIERNGVRYRIYMYSYTLSNGRGIGFAESERVKDEGNQ